MLPNCLQQHQRVSHGIRFRILRSTTTKSTGKQLWPRAASLRLRGEHGMITHTQHHAQHNDLLHASEADLAHQAAPCATPKNTCDINTRFRCTCQPSSVSSCAGARRPATATDRCSSTERRWHIPAMRDATAHEMTRSRCSTWLAMSLPKRRSMSGSMPLHLRGRERGGGREEDGLSRCS